MIKAQIDAPGELQRAAELLFKNWVLAIPTALASLISGILGIFVFGAVLGTALAGGLVGGRAGAGLAAVLSALPLAALYIVICVLLTMLAQAVVIHAAEEAWEGRPIDFGRSFAVASSRLLPLVGAFVLIALIMIIPALLAIFIIGILLMIVVGFFLMYVLPAVVLGEQGPAAALSDSYRIVRENFMPSLIAFIGIVVAAVVGGIVNALLHHGTILSLIGSLFVGGFVSAYIALVVARFYSLLRNQTLAPVQAPA